MRGTLWMLLSIAWLAAGISGAAEETRPALSPGRARVAVPVADLRKEPAPAGPTLEHDPLEESQLLYGEPVTVLEIQGEWARVAAPDQQEWTHNRRWEGYPGWMPASALIQEPRDWEPNLLVTSKTASLFKTPDLDSPPLSVLSLGSQLHGIREVRVCFSRGSRQVMASAWEVRLLDGTTCLLLGISRHSGEPVPAGKGYHWARDSVVRTARLFLGDPYYWGGRSAPIPEAAAPPHTAVDCSGLTGLCYQAAGIRIPRDAHEQWMKARPIPREGLQPADLVFLADPEDALKITHVMLYAGDGKVIEGPGTATTVREIALEERLKEAADRRVYYGSYL